MATSYETTCIKCGDRQHVAEMTCIKCEMTAYDKRINDAIQARNTARALRQMNERANKKCGI